MSPRLTELVERATDRAAALGHSLDWQGGNSGRECVGLCVACSLFAVASTAPDEAPMSGSTLDVECEGIGTLPQWHEDRTGSWQDRALLSHSPYASV